MAKGKIAVNVEYGALRTFCALLNALPYPLAMALARGFGWLLVRVFRFKRRRTFERIRGVFPEMDEESAVPEREGEESKTARACGFEEIEDLEGWQE